MPHIKTTIKRLLYGLVVVAILMTACPAYAEFVVAEREGWSFSTDGNVNLFMRYATADERPENVHSTFDTLSDDQDSFRVRSGFLPGVLAFNIKAPTIGGLDMAARVGFYPNPQNGNTKNSFGGQIDLREIYFTVDGDFGQFLVGKAFSLFQAQNCLTGVSVYGFAVEGAVGGGGATLGNIGYGYLYPQFNAQIRYTTPEKNGFKLALAIHDPSQIKGEGVALDESIVNPSAVETTTPRVEAEVSYAGTYAGSDGTIKSWVSGLFQKAEFSDKDMLFDGDVTAFGAAGGVLVGYKGYEMVASAFTGQALGSTLMLDYDSLDYTGEERDSMGYLLQGTYTFDNRFGSTKLALCYGANQIDETSAEKEVRAATGSGELEQQGVITAGIYHDINDHLKLVFEYNHANIEWFNGGDQDVDIIAVGTFFTW